jgi:hypothetical protein
MDSLERGPSRPLLRVVDKAEERGAVAGAHRITTGLAA